MNRPSLLARLCFVGALWGTLGMAWAATGAPVVTHRLVLHPAPSTPPPATMPATAPTTAPTPVATPRTLPAPPRGITAPVRRHDVAPRPWCFLGTLPTCDGAAPMWSCPDSTVWPDPAVPCHYPWEVKS